MARLVRGSSPGVCLGTVFKGGLHVYTALAPSMQLKAEAALPRPLPPEAHVLPEREHKVISRAFAHLVADLDMPTSASMISATTRPACPPWPASRNGPSWKFPATAIRE